MMKVRKDLSDDKEPNAMAYWESVHEEGDSHARQEVMTFASCEEAPFLESDNL